MVKNPPSNAGDVGSVPGWGTNALHAMKQLSPRARSTEPCAATRETGAPRQRRRAAKDTNKTQHRAVPALSPHPYLCPRVEQLLETFNLFAVIRRPLLRKTEGKLKFGEKLPLMSEHTRPSTFTIRSRTPCQTPGRKCLTRPT